MTDRTILMTGCSSGIGYAAARTLSARPGWRAVAACRKQADVDRLRAEGLLSVRIDYEDEDSIAAGFSEALELLGGRLDALYNNGAYAVPGAVEDLPTDALRAIFEANFFGWHSLTRRAIPVMRSQGHGRIVQCSSVLGFTALTFRGAYQSTKFALEGYTDTLRIELAGSGLHAILIEPGPIASKIRENSRAHFYRWVDWENSVGWATLYRDKLIPRINFEGSTSKSELGPEAVVAKLIHAIESDRPRPRYFVTQPTWVSAIAKRLLTTRAFDAFCLRASR